MKKTILLVEPDYPIRYPNLALMKFSAYYKSLGYSTRYLHGEKRLSFSPQEILISTLFTYYAEKTLRCIRFYREQYPDSKVRVGGVFASLMPGYIEGQTGVKPEVGAIDEIDRIRPDYDLLPAMARWSPYIRRWADYSILFTTRGCGRTCDFCGVGRLEPKRKIIENWRDLIDPSKGHVLFLDNNLTAFDFDHFRSVMEFLIATKLRTFFNNGFDVRLLTDEHLDLLAKVRWQASGLRLAFDNMTQDGHAQRAIKTLLGMGVNPSAFTVFCLFNFRDTFEDAMYRHREVANLGVRPYSQPYTPLDCLNKNDAYVSPKWTWKRAYEFRQYWFHRDRYSRMTFDEYIRSIGLTEEDLLRNEKLKRGGRRSPAKVAEG